MKQSELAEAVHSAQRVMQRRDAAEALRQAQKMMDRPEVAEAVRQVHQVMQQPEMVEALRQVELATGQWRSEGERLRTWRAEHGLSQAAAARLVGVDANTWARWERGEYQAPAM